MVLIVDDDRLFVHLLRRRLRGHEVLWAPTLAAARRILGTRPKLSLMLLDMGLPDGHGIHLLAACPDELPVVAMTGFSPFPDRDALAALGAVACVEKDALITMNGGQMMEAWAGLRASVSLTG